MVLDFKDASWILRNWIFSANIFVLIFPQLSCVWRRVEGRYTHLFMGYTPTEKLTE